MSDQIRFLTDCERAYYKHNRNWVFLDEDPSVLFYARSYRVRDL